MEKKIHITEFAPVRVTRPRGEEAYRRLNEILQSGPIEIDLSEIESLSLSFLDELILRLMEASQLTEATFLVPNPEILQKLSRVAEIRSASIFFRSKSGEPKQIVRAKETPRIVLKKGGTTANLPT